MGEDTMRERDPLDDFERRELTCEGKRKAVFVSGTGPAVIVISEMPGITPYVARFARWVRDAGFTVYLPHLFGVPGAPGSKMREVRALAEICISREFHLLRSDSSGPIAAWLRALARYARDDAGGKGVGAIGMCITGNFALSMMLEEAVLAPVLAEPSLPLTNKAGLHIAPDELEQVQRRLEAESLTVRGYRFKGDKYCKKERFDAYHDALGARWKPRCLDDSDANPESPMKNPHSVFTHHLIDKEGEPTRDSVNQVIEFFTERLHGD